MSKKRIKVTDICTILKKCSIDEISKYLTNQGIKKDFPDITQRQDFYEKIKYCNYWFG